MSLLRPTHSITATVLGAGTMGAQIAAHLANAGIRTFLLDMVPKGTAADAPRATRNALALGAMALLLKSKPAAYTDPAHAARITPGNLEDDLDRACAASDLVIEAVVERLDIKQALFTRVAAAAGPNTILTSNTSGLAIGAIAEGLPEAARARLVGLHFFNPPRYMHLLEVVPSRHSDPAIVAELAEFSDRTLGKGVVLCRDTPNFIGNRVGTAEMLLTFRATTDGDYTVEEVDHLNGPLMGRPRTGSYRLGDMVGIDIVGHVIKNLHEVLSGDPAADNYDELHDLMVVPPMIAQMLERRMLGDKTKGGFYRKTGKGGIQSLDLHTLEYRDTRPAVFPELAEVGKLRDLGKRVHAALRAQGRAGEFLRKVYLPLFNYAAHRVGVISETAKQIDDAMCWGYGWQMGPFALMDAAGVGWCAAQLQAMGIAPAPALAELAAKGEEARWYGGRVSAPTIYVPGAGPRPIPSPADVVDLAAVKDIRGTLHRNDSAALIDLGDGIACLEFRGKMNILDEPTVRMLAEAPAHLEQRGGFRGLVIGNQGDNFCAGADLAMIFRASKAEVDFEVIDRSVRALQDALMNLRHGALPVVVATHGTTLGGGVEVALHGHAVVAASELYMGLVEIGVGLLPAGGGLKEMARRASEWAAQVPDGDPYPFVRRAFENAAAGKVSSSAHEARNMGFLRPDDGVVFHKARVLAAAKRRAISLAEAGHVPPDRDAPISLVDPGRGASLLMGAQMFFWGGYASAHDQKIAQKIAHVLSGGMSGKPTATAQQLLDLEREAFCSLVGEPATKARILHMLETGKPLRN